ncbi:MAG: hypothetical protein KDI62_05450, partial [Anaerolineae bacterium]|nr:hypothetical protein [Anaerolineae bacterium]
LHTSTVFLYPTVAFSFVIFLLIWQRMLPGKGWAMRDLVSVSLLLFLLFGIKFYAAATMLCMIGVYLLLDFIDRKDSRHTLLQASIICLACGVSLVVFYNIQKASAGEPVFGWAPLAAVHQIIEDANMYPNSQLAMARDTLYTIGKFSPRLVAIEGFSLILFTIHHFGLRAVGMAYLVWLIVRKRAVKSDIAACAGMIFSFGMGILFAQRGWHWWNTLQFHYYTALIAAFYTARFVYEIIFLRTDKRYVRIIVILILVLLSIPDAVEKAIEIGKTQHTTVSAVEMQAVHELSRKPQGVVLTAPLMPETAYVSALSGHTLFYADEQMLQNNGIDYVSRKELLSEPENLDLNNIPANYAYFVRSDPNYELLLKKAKDTSFRELYENDEVVLLER